MDLGLSDRVYVVTGGSRGLGFAAAEVLVAADRSCLMHLGGLMSRSRGGVRMMHLAEVLAQTEESQAGHGHRRAS